MYSLVVFGTNVHHEVLGAQMFVVWA